MWLGAREGERGGVASVLGLPPLFPVPVPKACVCYGGHLAPRGPASTEPPRAAGGRRAESWAPDLVEPAGAVAISRWYREEGARLMRVVNGVWGFTNRVWWALASVRCSCCFAFRYLFAQMWRGQARAWCQARGLTRSTLVPAGSTRASETL